MSESSSSQQPPGAEAEAAAAAPPSYLGVPGVRFVPSDQELIIDYLWPKINGEKLPTDLVQEADVYAEHPKDLTERLGRGVENFWYVFSKRNRKYGKGLRPSRSTGTTGRWKAVGKNGPVVVGNKDKRWTIGHKCSLSYEVFVQVDDDQSEGSRPRSGKRKATKHRTEKTEWKMTEFVAENTNRPILPESAPDRMLLNEWVLCRITRKAAGAAATAVEEEHHQQEAPPVDEPHEDEQLQVAPPDPSQQAQAQAQAMPDMPYQLLHEGSDGSDVTQVEPSPNGHGAATDVQFVDWMDHDHLELCGAGNVGVNRFGAATDPDPMANQFGVPADPDSAVSPIELPSGPQLWDLVLDSFFSNADESHGIAKANDDAGKDNAAAANKTSAPATASAQQSQK